MTARDRAPLPSSKQERVLVGAFAETVENGDIERLVALLTDDAWLTMPPLPHAYQGREAIGGFLRGAAARRGVPMRLVATRANTQPAFGCYLPAPDTGVARALALLVLTLEDDAISAITWFATAARFRGSVSRACCRTPDGRIAARLTANPASLVGAGSSSTSLREKESHASCVASGGAAMTASQPSDQTDPRVDDYIDALPDWQQAICRRLRGLIRAADRELIETIKRTVQPYFVLEGNVCALLAAKDHVNLFLYDGGIVPDPEGIITAGHENKTARRIAFYRGDTINAPALTAMLEQIIANNRAGGWRKLKARNTAH